MEFSRFGKKLTLRSGILELMDDLGTAMSGPGHINMLGGGNPAHIPECNELWRERMAQILSDNSEFDRMLANYDTPQGKTDFLKAVADYLSSEYGWQLGPENIAVTNGSQSAFFFLFNLLAGEMEDGSIRKILFPLVPEYIGYADQGLDSRAFVSYPALIEKLPDRRFKYHIDFDALKIGSDIAALCVSRPTNPTGNVLTDNEIARLADLTREAGIPLIIDNAYGAPFPNILFRDINLKREDHFILGMSLSKIGLPSVRTGILVASPEIVQAVTAVNAIVSLANNSIGQVIAAPLIADGSLRKLSLNTVRPYYEEKSLKAQAWLDEALDGLPYRLHVSEGALFLWLWLPGLPISSMELYNRLKERDTLIIPGEYFFYGGFDKRWHTAGMFSCPDSPPPAGFQRMSENHVAECIRITYSQQEDMVKAGIRILGEEVRKAYCEKQ